MTEQQQLLGQVYNEIVRNEREDIVQYYNTVSTCYLNISKYLEQLDSILDKIILAQKCENMEMVESLVSNIELPEEQYKKYKILLTKNEDLNKTLNFHLLLKKYDFLNPILDWITTDINMQQLIISLSDDRLELFKKLLNHLETTTNYTIPYVAKILNRMGSNPFNKEQKNYYEELTSEMEHLVAIDYSLSEKDLEVLLYLYNSDFLALPIKNIWDVRDFDNIIEKAIEEEIVAPERNKENPDINRIKNALLLKSFGISTNTAKAIKTEFDFSNIEITEDNKEIATIYSSIIEIFDEQDPNVLLTVYDEFSKTQKIGFDFMQSTVIGEDLKRAFANELTKSTFKTEGKEPQIIEGVSVYDAGTDFKMIVTAIGAYQADFSNQENYSEYWNSSKIESHGNCCSLIANNNLSMATVKNIILGFSSMDDSMLMMSGTRDLSSSDCSKDLYVDYRVSGNYMGPDDLINNTRSDYNELVYERRDLSENATNFKKNPDYIVFIEEYDNFDEWLEHYKNNEELTNILLNQKQEEERKWRETVKAAKDFGIPIVKINRETCARNEANKIEEQIKLFIDTHDPNILAEFITQFENNHVGLCSPHEPLKFRYFSPARMKFYLDGIQSIIENEDKIKQAELLDIYKNAIEMENNKLQKLKYGRCRNNKQTCSFNIKERLQYIDELKRVLQEPVLSDEEQIMVQNQAGRSI